jgi:Gamma-thionin family
VLKKKWGPVSLEAKTFESPSQNFKGMCMHQSNCANICHGEGFQGAIAMVSVVGAFAAVIADQLSDSSYFCS